MLYEVITGLNNTPKGEETLGTPEIREVLKTVENNTAAPGEIAGTVTKETSENVITSYSIHYTKLYDPAAIKLRENFCQSIPSSDQ